MPKGQESSQQPTPYVLAIVICDGAHVDPTTGKVTLLGLFSVLFAEEFPFAVPQIVVYGALTDGRGITPVTVKLVDSEEARDPIFEGEVDCDFTDPRDVASFLVEMGELEFPEPGEYRVQLWSCNTLLSERKIVVDSERPEASNE